MLLSSFARRIYIFRISDSLHSEKSDEAASDDQNYGAIYTLRRETGKSNQ